MTNFVKNAMHSERLCITTQRAEIQLDFNSAGTLGETPKNQIWAGRTVFVNSRGDEAKNF